MRTVGSHRATRVLVVKKRAEMARKKDNAAVIAWILAQAMRIAYGTAEATAADATAVPAVSSTAVARTAVSSVAGSPPRKRSQPEGMRSSDGKKPRISAVSDRASSITDPDARTTHADATEARPRSNLNDQAESRAADVTRDAVDATTIASGQQHATQQPTTLGLDSE